MQYQREHSCSAWLHLETPHAPLSTHIQNVWPQMDGYLCKQLPGFHIGLCGMLFAMYYHFAGFTFSDRPPNGPRSVFLVSKLRENCLPSCQRQTINIWGEIKQFTYIYAGRQVCGFGRLNFSLLGTNSLTFGGH